MVLGKKWLFSIGNGAEIRPLEMGRKSLARPVTITIQQRESNVIRIKKSTIGIGLCEIVEKKTDII